VSIAINAGDDQSATVGTAVSTAPSVIVKDANNNVVSGVSVTFAVASGGGSLGAPATVTTDASGIATSPAWTLGTTAGANTLTATSAGLTGSPVTFTATGTTVPTQIERTAGNGQTAVAGQAVPNGLQVQVLDANDNGVPNASVIFTVTQGGGLLGGASSATITTDSSGFATSPAWTLGTVAGENRATAGVTGLAGTVTFTATGTAGAASKLVLTTEAAGAVSGAAFVRQPVVAIRDAQDNLTGSTAVVTMTVSAGGTVVVGTATATAARRSRWWRSVTLRTT
jgi:adhesin/invasin